jgi:hypothetical protein
MLDTIKVMVDAQDPKNSEAMKNLYSACDLTKGVLEGKVCVCVCDMSCW